MLERSLRIILLLGLTVSPCLFFPQVHETFLLPKAAFVFLCLAVSLPLWALHISKHGFKLHWPMDGYLAALLLVAAGSYFAAADKLLYGYNLAFMLGFFLYYLILSQVLTEPEHLETFLKAVYGVSLLISVNGTLQYLFYRGWISYTIMPVPYKPAGQRFYRDRIFATLGQPNNMALYVSLGLLIGLYFMFRQADNPSPLRRRLSRLGLLTGTGLQFFVIEASGGLGLLGALIGLAVFAAGMYILRGKRFKLHKAWLLGAAVLVLGIFIISQWVLTGSSSWQRTTEAVEQIATRKYPNNTITHRFLYWMIATEMLMDSSLRGVGLGNFRRYFSPAQANLIARLDSELVWRNATFTVYAHNEFMRFLAETGLVGFALAVIIWGLMGWHIIKMLRTRPHPVGVLIASFWGMYSLHLIVSNPFMCMSLIVVWAFIVVAWSRFVAGYEPRGYSLPPRPGKILLGGSLLLSGLLVLGVWINVKAAAEIVEVARTERAKLLDPLWIKQHSLNPYFEISLLDLSGRELYRRAVMQNDRNLLMQAKAVYERAQQMEPRLFYCVCLASIYFRLGEPQAGLAYLRLANRYVPYNIEVLFMLKEFHERSQDKSQAQYWQGQMHKALNP